MRMRNLINFTVVTSLLIIALSSAYYLVIFLPDREKARRDFETQKVRYEYQENQNNRNSLNECVSSAYDSYLTNWKATCRYKGFQDDCALYGTVADSINKSRTESEALCVKMYPVK